MYKIFTILALLFTVSCATVQESNLAYPTPIIASEEIAQPISQPSKESIRSSLNLAFDKSEWTEAEKWAFTLSTTAHLADLYTSMNSDWDLCREDNLILGEHPSNAGLIAVKLAAIGFEYWLYNNPRFRKNTHWYGFTSAIIHGATAYNSRRNDCYRGL